MFIRFYHIIILLLFVSILKSQNSSDSNFAFTIDKKIIPLYDHSKTIIVVIPNVYCSGCVKKISSFFVKQIKQKENFSLFILTEGYDNKSSFNRAQINHFTQLFPYCKGVYFEFPERMSKEERLRLNLTSYFNLSYPSAAYPLIILINEEAYLLFKYNEFNNKTKKTIKRFCHSKSLFLGRKN